MDRLVRRQTIFVAKLTVVLRWLTWIKKEPPPPSAPRLDQQLHSIARLRLDEKIVLCSQIIEEVLLQRGHLCDGLEIFSEGVLEHGMHFLMLRHHGLLVYNF